MAEEVKYPQFELIDNIMTTSTIYCDRCGRQESAGGDADEVMDHFYEEGWRKGRTKIYCPHCAALKLKPKKKNENKRTSKKR